MKEAFQMMIALAFVAFCMGLYVAPTFVAFKRHHPNLASIIVVNILLGWTLLGWAAALAWSVAAFPGQNGGNKTR